MIIKSVTGASYGDEGKGLMTDHFCKEALEAGRKCITVLHNGGAQRGHTTVTEEGLRHVFHHLSAGTFSYSDSYFADSFIINPSVFAEEHMGLMPDVRIYCSPLCRWSTPFDMMINQIAEESRGEKRHGSCGCGIWETVVRYNSGLYMTFPEFMKKDMSGKREYLELIRDVYLPQRLKALGVNSLPEEWAGIVYNKGLTEKFTEDCGYFYRSTERLEKIPPCDELIFEGAQGLLLNADMGENEKYTTPSLTGGDNPVRLIKEISADRQTESLEVCYVTRTYLTRHGAGPMENECPKEEINPEMTDITNLPNPWQGTLRYGKIDPESLMKRVKRDFEKYSCFEWADMSMCVTHMNETEGKFMTPKGNISPKAVDVKKMYYSCNEYSAFSEDG